MQSLFIWIYSAAGGVKLMKNLREGCKVWKSGILCISDYKDSSCAPDVMATRHAGASTNCQGSVLSPSVSIIYWFIYVRFISCVYQGIPGICTKIQSLCVPNDKQEL
jgi:hypothetical protein